jgi:secreted trypsin-like serine protease
VRQAVEEWGAGVTDPTSTTATQMTRSVVRVTAFNATTITVSNSVAQTCLGDSGGPIFAGASDLIVGVVSQLQQARNSNCAVSTGPTVTARITPAVIDFINNNRAGRDPVCHETLPGSGFQTCF